MVKSAYGKDGNKILKEMLTQEGYESTDGLPTSVFNRITEKVMGAVSGGEKPADTTPSKESSGGAPTGEPAEENGDQPDFKGGK
jgi:hypothetical protein